jgi:hypothetical protein
MNTVWLLIVVTYGVAGIHLDTLTQTFPTEAACEKVAEVALQTARVFPGGSIAMHCVLTQVTK